MSGQLGSSRGRASMGVQQLRDKIGQICSSAGLQTQPQKTEYLKQYFGKWSMNAQRMTQQQFIGALQSLQLPLSGAGEVFGALDTDGSGYVDIREFCDAMIAGVEVPKQTGPRLATRNAGNDIIMSGRRPSGDPNERSAPLPPKAMSQAERGYTPTGAPPVPKIAIGSRNGSRMGSANRSPAQPSTPQPQHMSTIKPSQASTASRPRPNRAAPMDVDFSDLVISKFRAVVLARGGSGGIHSMARVFRIMDDDRNRRISLEELSYGLQDYGLRMGPKDLQLLLAAVDKDNTGSLSFDEFLVAIRGVVNARRQAMISMAFDVLDATGDGQIQVDDIASSFDANGHPDVVEGRIPPEAALTNFLSQFDGVDQNGTVTREEFLEYYKNVSASIDDDDYFELMIRNAWHISGGTGQSRNTANTRVLVTLVDGTQKVVALQHDLGLDMRDAAAVKAQLKAQGIANVVSFSTGGQV